MRSITRALCITLAIGAAAAAVNAAQESAKPAARADRGEQILKDTCVSCHDMSAVTLSFMSKDEWTAKVKSMVDKGAKLKPEDMPVLVNYLVQQHGYELPDGPGKEVFQKTCNGFCHDVQRIVSRRWTRDRWDSLLDEMINNGVDIADDDYETLLTYLAKNFKPAQ